MRLRATLFLITAAAALPAWAEPPATTGTRTPPPLPQQAAAPLSLAEVLGAAARNLDVRMAEQALAASRADILAADHAPLPVLSGKASSNDQPTLNGGTLGSVRRIDRQLGVDWTWERGGKRALRTEAARKFAAASEADLKDTLTLQRLAAKDAYFDLLAAQTRQEHLDAMAQTARQLAELARRRLAAGDMSAQDLARVEIEAQRAQADLQSATLERQHAALALAQVTGTQLRALPAAQWRVQDQWPATGTSGAQPEVEAWIDSRPDVQSAQRRLEAAQALVDNAQALKKLDPTLGLSVDTAQDASRRLVELRLQLPLTVNYRYEGEIGRALATRDQAQEMLDKVRLLARNDWDVMTQELSHAAARLATYQGEILPRARRVAEQAELAYGKGAIALVDLLDARRTLKASLLEALAVQNEHAKALLAWQLRSQPADAAAAPAQP
ncbi:MAG: hypothetical protein RJA36_2046 [Pseudomonadota bacterium]|jgi:cobalt-zinc-cadmium efflux system outer membrane protein